MESCPETLRAPTPDRTAPGLAIGLLFLLAGWRVLLGWMTTRHGFAAALPTWLPGFTPMAALAVGGGFLLPRRLGWVVTLGALLGSDVALTVIYGQSMGVGLVLTRYVVLLALTRWGMMLRAQRFSRGAMVAGSVAGSVVFYAATNTVSWMGDAGYAHSLAGWVQALTVGLPGFPPSWVFFRNSLVSDALVSMLLAATCLPWSRPDMAHAGTTPVAGLSR